LTTRVFTADETYRL